MLIANGLPPAVELDSSHLSTSPLHFTPVSLTPFDTLVLEAMEISLSRFSYGHLWCEDATTLVIYSSNFSINVFK